MALIPKTVQQILLQTTEGESVVSIDPTKVSQVLIETSTGSYLVSVTDGVVVPVLIVTDSGLAQADLEFIEDSEAPSYSGEIRFDFGMGVNKLSKKVVTLSAATLLEMVHYRFSGFTDMWVPEIRHMKATLSHSYTPYEVFFSTSLQARYAIGQLKVKNPLS